MAAPPIDVIAGSEVAAPHEYRKTPQKRLRDPSEIDEIPSDQKEGFICPLTLSFSIQIVTGIRVPRPGRENTPQTRQGLSAEARKFH